MKDPVRKRHAITIILPVMMVLICLSIVHVSAIEITVDGSLSVPLDPRTFSNTTEGTLTVSSTNELGWTVKVADAKDTGKTHDGHMQEYVGGSYGTRFLAENMTVSGNTDSEQYVADTPVVLTGLPNSQTLEYTSSQVTSISIPIIFSQPVAYSDARLSSGTYRIVVEFDASDNA